MIGDRCPGVEAGPAPHGLKRLARLLAGAWSRGEVFRRPLPAEEAAQGHGSDLAALEDDLLAAELASEERADLRDDLLTGRLARRRTDAQPPDSCLVLGLAALSRGEVLWARLDSSGNLLVMVRGSEGEDRVVAEVADYLSRPECLLAIEAAGQRFSAETLLIREEAAGHEPGYEARYEPAEGEAQQQAPGDRLPYLLSHPWDEGGSLPDMLAEASLDVPQDG